MKTVGLLTVHRVNNCGSYLQTYATVKAVEKFGCECTVIDYKYPSLWHLKHSIGDEHQDVRRKSFLKQLLDRIGVLSILRDIKIWNCYRVGAKGLCKFAHVKKTKPYTRRGILRSPPKFDIYLTGSDQVWNPRYMATDYTYLLDFTPESSSRVSYAASFGCKQLPEEFVGDYSRLLSRYDRISVRESSGVPLVCALSGMTATDVVDPTFLLSREEWCEKACDKLGARRGFVFCYIMTYVFDPFPSLVDYLKFLADKFHKDVIVYCPEIIPSLQNDARFHFIVARRHMLEPQEFLEYYQKADYIVSTSFHGVAFAINFRKDFLAVLNPNKSSDDRVLSLLRKTSLENRGVVCGGKIHDTVLNPTNYRLCGLSIESLVNSSKAYLKSALSE